MNSLLQSPASNPLGERLPLDSEMTREVAYRERATGVNDRANGVTAVRGLFLFGSPANIAQFVISRVVWEAIKRKRLMRSFANRANHIFLKLGELSPLRTILDA